MMKDRGKCKTMQEVEKNIKNNNYLMGGKESN